MKLSLRHGSGISSLPSFQKESKAFVRHALVVIIVYLGLVIFSEYVTSKIPFSIPHAVVLPWVITSSDLAHYYESLIIWKKTKGLKAEIHTTDEIKSLYPEDDIQLSIKKYLESRMKDDLEYVLLGGDDTVV